MTMPIRQVLSPAETKQLDTDGLRSNYLLEGLFQNGAISMTYSHLDRTIIGGIIPTAGPLKLESEKQIGSPNFLDRREMGVFLLSGAGTITVDGEVQAMNTHDCLYIPMGCTDVLFGSNDAKNPAHFYFISTPAHHRHPQRLITKDEAIRHDLGAPKDANVRILRQYIHPDVCDSCQLVMGMTTIQEGSVWNTMPCHTHDRRSEVYLYFEMAEATRVFHMMGKPQETRHLIVADEQAILSPGWSIHSGTATGSYAFIWSMGGDNQDFTDMDFVAMEDLR